MPFRRATSEWSTGRWIAAILALIVNLGFIAFLVINVTWRSRAEEPVSVELYAPRASTPEPPKAQPEPPKPQPEPPKPQPEPPKPEPPKPEPPTPAPEPPKPPAPSKADIALKAQQEKAERERVDKEKREAEKREADKREADRRKQEEKRVAEARERQQKEADAMRAQAERERVAMAKQADAERAAQNRAMDAYIRSIQAKVRGNVVLPPDLPGNPEAIFDVIQLPTGEIIDAQLRKSSGVRAYDDAVQRAIMKSSPLPRPESPDMFRRSLTLRFRPLD
jgi:colicin import membrane protein